MAGCQKSSGPHVWDNETRPGRALKKFVQQDRSEFRPESYPLGYVEDLNDARTPLADFFSILLERLSLTPTRLFEEECALRKGLVASVGDLLGI